MLSYSYSNSNILIVMRWRTNDFHLEHFPTSIVMQIGCNSPTTPPSSRTTVWHASVLHLTVLPLKKNAETHQRYAELQIYCLFPIVLWFQVIVNYKLCLTTKYVSLLGLSYVPQTFKLCTPQKVSKQSIQYKLKDVNLVVHAINADCSLNSVD